MPDALPPVADIPLAPSYGSLETLGRQLGHDELLQIAPGPDGESLDEALLLDALRRASREADSYLATRYSVPLKVYGEEQGLWPEPLTSFVADMAHYHLLGGSARDDEAISRRYQEALDWLKAIAKGLADLPPAPDGGEEDDDEGGGIGSVAFAQCGRQATWR